MASADADRENPIFASCLDLGLAGPTYEEGLMDLTLKLSRFRYSGQRPASRCGVMADSRF